jgi:thiosulfate/3-mercaptopyruvate sulfurtransferase
VAQQLGNPEWLCVDCRFDLEHPDAGRSAYLQAHIPGAVYAHLDHDLCGAKTGRNGRHPLPSIDSMAKLFSDWGINSTTRVVAYDQNTSAFAARLWWMLRYLGHEQVTVLEGGFDAWLAAKLPTEESQVTRQPSRFIMKPRTEMLVSIDQVKSVIEEKSALLIDSRAPERYWGVEEPYDRIPGHIPGAANRYWMNNIQEDGTFLSKDQLQKAFDQVRGHFHPDKWILYCGSGVTACHNLLALEVMGYKGARLYGGSYSEWSADLDNPIDGINSSSSET